MRNRKTRNFLCILLSILAGLLLLISVPAAALPLADIEGAVGGWQASPSGAMAFRGNDLVLEDALGYEDETDFTARLKIGTPLVLPNIYLMATPLKYEETATLSEGFTFGEKSFEAETDFRSRLTLDHYDIGLYYNVPLVKTFSLHRLNLEAGLNARIIDAQALVEQEAGGERVVASKSEIMPVPMVYLGAGLYPVERFGLEMELRGISYSDYDLLSVIGRLRVKAFGSMFISGGYRYEACHVKKDGLKIDVDFSGPFLEAGLKF